MKKPKERIIYENYDIFNDDMIEAAKENLEANNVEATEENINNEIYEMNQDDWNLEKERMEEVFNSGNKFLAVGTCARWNGNFAGGFVFASFNELMSYLRDCDYFKFWDENGHFYVNATHHDGTHSLEIKQVTDRGRNYYENWEYKWEDFRTEQEIHKKIFADSHYSKLINFANIFYGCPKREFA